MDKRRRKQQGWQESAKISAKTSNPRDSGTSLESSNSSTSTDQILPLLPHIANKARSRITKKRCYKLQHSSHVLQLPATGTFSWTPHATVFPDLRLSVHFLFPNLWGKLITQQATIDCLTSINNATTNDKKHNDNTPFSPANNNQGQAFHNNRAKKNTHTLRNPSSSTTTIRP